MGTSRRRLTLEVEAILTARANQAEAEIKDFDNELQKMMLSLGRTSDLLEDQRLAFNRLSTGGRELTDEWKALDRASDSTYGKLLTQREGISDSIEEMKKMEYATEGQKDALNEWELSIDKTIKSHEELTDAMKQQRNEAEAQKQEIDDQERSYERLIDTFEKGSQELDHNIIAFNRLTLEGRQMTDEWVQLDRAVDRNYATLNRQRIELREATQEMGKSGIETEKLSNLMLRYSVALDATVPGQRELYRAMKETRDAAREETRALEEQERQAEELANQVRILKVDKDELRKTAIFGGVAGIVGGLTSAVTNSLIDGLHRMIDAVKEFAREADKSFAEAEESALRLKAQVYDLDASVESLMFTASASSLETGFLPQATIEATRKALNLNLDYEEALLAVEDSANAAKVANVDLVDTLVAGTSASIAYQGAMGDTGDILDYYSYATQQSNLEMGELVQGMTAIISPAAEAKLGIRDITAAMVGMSRIGDDFKEIQSLLGNLLIQLSVGGTSADLAFREAAGVGFKEFLAQGNNIVDVLELLDDAASKSNKSVTDLLGGGSAFFRDVQAARGAQELVQQIDTVTEAYAELANVEGTAADQAAIFDDSMYSVNRRLDASRENAEIFAGGAFGGLSRFFKETKIGWFDFIAESGRAKYAMDSFIREMEEAVLLADEDFVFGPGLFGADSPETDTLIDDIQTMQHIFLRYQELATDADGSVNWTQAIESTERFTEVFEELVKKGEEFTIADVYALADYVEPAVIDYYDFIYDRTYSIAQETEKIADKIVTTSIETGYWNVKIRESVDAFANLREAYIEGLDFIADSFDRAYNKSLTYIDSLIELQGQLEAASSKEEIEDAERALDEFGQQTTEDYQRAVLSTIAANEGYSVSLIAVAESLGLITPELAAQQHEYILMATQVDALSKVLKDQSLSVDAQAEAIKNVTENGMTAVDAIALANRNLEQEQDIFEATGYYGNVGIIYDETSADPFYDEMRDLEETVWEPTVELFTDPARDEADRLSVYLDQVLEDRNITVTLNYVDPNQDEGEGGGGSGGKGLIPPEQTTSTQEDDDSPIGLASGGGGISFVFNNYYYGDVDPDAVAAAQAKEFEDALVEKGLV